MLASQKGVTEESSENRDVLGHWVWVIPILLIVAALSLKQIDAYPPSQDEFYAMHNSGWLAERAYSPHEIMASLQKQSFAHMPGYFLLLGFWGNLTSYSVAMARVLSIFFGILGLAVIYRQSEELAGPSAGIIAVIIAGSNAFYNFYYAYSRMYTLLVLCAATAMWLYLRIVQTEKRILGRYYVALVVTHPFSAVLLATLSIYHLLFVSKDRRWAFVATAVLAGLLLISPFLLNWSTTIGITILRRTIALSDYILDGPGAIRIWLGIILNNQWALLLFSLVGLAIGIRNRSIKSRTWLLIPFVMLIIFALLAEFTPFIIESAMRYYLAGWILFIPFIAAGIYGLCRYRICQVLLTLLWCISGVWFQSFIDEPAGWKHQLGWQSHIYSLPPWQVVSREATRAAHLPQIIGYVNTSFELRTNMHINYSQILHYFDQFGITFRTLDDLHWFEGVVSDNAITAPSIWFFYQSQLVNREQVTRVMETLEQFGYELCGRFEAGNDSTVMKYYWEFLGCQPAQLESDFQSKLIRHQFYGAKVVGSSIQFVDHWVSQKEFEHAQYDMSFQLISESWNNEAQVDLPLVHEDSLRQFSIGIADVPPGTYRLMAILYDKRTGENVDWIDNPGYVPGMMELSEIVIPQG